MMGRLPFLVVAIVLGFALLASEAGLAQEFPLPFGSGGRGADQRQGFGSFFGGFFGGGFAPVPPRGLLQPRRLVPREPPLPTLDVVDKDPKARKVLVIGDFTAGGLAWGLDQTFAEEPKLKILDASNSSSGFIRPEFFDWNKEITNLLNSEHPDVIVVMIGANDRQQMRAGNVRIAMHSADWEKTYVARVANLADTLKVYGRPYFWLSAPPMRGTEISDDMIYLNSLYKPAVEAAGGHFIDIWSGFTNEDGHYDASGPDVEGQARALRTADGVNFTRAGRLKLAFYLEREIRKATGLGAGAGDLLATLSRTNQIEIGPDGKKRLVGPVISLTDPLPGADGTLAGEGAATTPPTNSPQYKLVVKGEALPSVAGRVDDFVWPPGSAPAAEPAEAPATAGEAEEPGLTPISKSD